MPRSEITLLQIKAKKKKMKRGKRKLPNKVIKARAFSMASSKMIVRYANKMKRLSSLSHKQIKNSVTRSAN